MGNALDSFGNVHCLGLVWENTLWDLLGNNRFGNVMGFILGHSCWELYATSLGHCWDIARVEAK